MPKIATWNVNSIKARLPNVLDWLREAEPDVVLLQEIKCQDDAFPRLEIEALGYRCAVHGQKSYNGVAILSKEPLEQVSSGLPGDAADEQARYLEATSFGIRLACLYLPNGNPAPGGKYDYKLAWMARLAARAEALLADERPVVMAGDYNVIPEPEDCHDPRAWARDALFLPDTRRAFRRLLWLGYTDAFRALHGEPHQYSFWDYQGGAWPADEGIRIDHLLLSPQAADRLTASGIDKAVRGREKASDHVPAWCVLEGGT
ncbi:exodeoxyribonuclease-3 [Tistlia consotensis]|uniref:Exodeoxyribonuclease-3 n=1 Tax=Tistlia consotensis USBA 355 TaxID=560819 RepID=A0A1Y6BJG5_9PROT|nr:exodeoxyribonuclease III [Tistlia consotensis]SMF14381.1 exodeoxyribonuclease-3 [Tistlia consotensis USBA 355]SNR49602.1 exodeoxyribonuclease-3 [Tistlia consotensis]